jgi:hypothetical protein
MLNSDQWQSEPSALKASQERGAIRVNERAVMAAFLEHIEAVMARAVYEEMEDGCYFASMLMFDRLWGRAHAGWSRSKP